MVARGLAVIVILLVVLAGIGNAGSVGYPVRPINMLVGGAPGSGTDIVGRGVAEAAKKHLPVPVVVLNRPGGAGTIAMAEVVLSKPDGYTIALGAVAQLTVQPHLADLPYRTPDDYTPIVKLANLPVVMFVRGDAPWKTASELLGFARANPGKLRVAIPGKGSILHLAVEELGLFARLELPTVVFASPHQVTAVLGGHIEAGVAHPALILGHVQAGKIRVVGVFQPKRNPLFPEAQTFREIGHDVTRSVYYFLLGPKATPRTITLILHDAFKKALAEPSFADLAQKNGFDVDYQGPGALTRDLWTSYEQYGRLVDYLGLKK